MSDANKALAEARSWLCDNLVSGDAGKICGMLSVVSRCINELEDENAKLREQVTQLQSEWESERDYADQMEAKEKKAVAENTNFRDALRVLVVGTNAELCAGRDYLNCKECSMHRDRESCAMTDAMGLLGCDAYGEPMESEERG